MVTGGPRRAAVVGSPISHSKSPALHLAAYRAAGHPQWSYEAVEVDAQGLADFVAQLGPQWLGLSVTMPCKEAALRIADWVDRRAQVTGAVNTLVFAADGPRRIAGYNTDVDGIVAALQEAGVHRVRQVAVLGAGATARSAVAAAVQLGAAEVAVYARRIVAATETAAVAHRLGVVGRPRPWAQARGCLAADLVISTVPAGAADGIAAEVAGTPTSAALLDVVYQPWPTPLAQQWAGPAVVSGLSMLMWQAVSQVRLMAAFDPDVAAMKTAVGLV